MKRDHISPFFSSPCTADCNYDPLGWAGFPTAGLTAATPGDGVCSTPRGPLDLSATGGRQKHDPGQLGESRNSQCSETSSVGRRDVFSLDQLIQLKKSRPVFRNTNPPSLSPASQGKEEVEQ